MGEDGLLNGALTHWAPEQWVVASDWSPVVKRFFQCDAGRALGHFLLGRLNAGATVYPPEPLQALVLTPLASIKVVILGQDPYHGPGQAHGLAFSVPPGVKVPPSLRNIRKEIVRDISANKAHARPEQTAIDRFENGSLLPWARQGVLLLNTTLTVEDGSPASHVNRGWEVLTDEIIKLLWARSSPTVFMLWGANAQSKARLMVELEAPKRPHLPTSGGSTGPHCVLKANHPSPLSALRPPIPFIGCGHFGKANAFLQAQGLAPIAW
jgi:uracil-DNA glycosylase